MESELSVVIFQKLDELLNGKDSPCEKCTEECKCEEKVCFDVLAELK